MDNSPGLRVIGKKKNTTATGPPINESPARSTAAASAKSKTEATAMKTSSQDSHKVTAASNQQDVEKKDKHQLGQERMDANNEEQDKDGMYRRNISGNSSGEVR